VYIDGAGESTNADLHLADGIEIGQSIFLFIDGIVFRDKDPCINAKRGEIFGKRADNIGESAGLCVRCTFGSDDGDIHDMLDLWIVLTVSRFCESVDQP
jgi:hypothetical protein